MAKAEAGHNTHMCALTCCACNMDLAKIKSVVKDAQYVCKVLRARGGQGEEPLRAGGAEVVLQGEIAAWLSTEPAPAEWKFALCSLRVHRWVQKCLQLQWRQTRPRRNLERLSPSGRCKTESASGAESPRVWACRAGGRSSGLTVGQVESDGTRQKSLPQGWLGARVGHLALAQMKGRPKAALEVLAPHSTLSS